MTIEELGSIGEFVAAFATLFTLIYLALQIRRSSAVGRAQGTAAFLSQLNMLSIELGKDPELHRLYYGGLSGNWETFSDDELFRFDNLVGTYLFCIQQAYLFEQEGVLAAGVWEQQRSVIIDWMIRQPGFRAHWQRWPRPEGMPFNLLINELLAEQENVS